MNTSSPTMTPAEELPLDPRALRLDISGVPDNVTADEVVTIGTELLRELSNLAKHREALTNRAEIQNRPRQS